MLKYAVLSVSLVLAAQTERDAAVGAWRFVASESTYESGPAPRESTRVFERDGDRIRFIHTGVGVNGQTFRTEYSAGYDGANYPVSGSGRYDTVSQKMIDARTVDLTFRLRGEVTVSARRTVSADGQVLRIEAKGTNPDGKAFRNILVYRKE